MINSELIIRYTDALYSADQSCLPRYDEFRDMFSSGQIKSKEWAISCLAPHLDKISSVAIVGGWFGTLGMMLNLQKPSLDITLVDIDPRCQLFIKQVSNGLPKVSAITSDMYFYNYTEDLVINTSCEHIPKLEPWLQLLPAGTKVLLQSNNNSSMDGHVNCSNSIEEFIEKSTLKNILYSGELVMPMYTRYMILGTK